MKRPILTSQIKEVTIPVKDLRRMITDLAYDTIEIVAQRVRRVKHSEKLDALVDVSEEERTTGQWMVSAMDMALREIETSYEDVGVHIKEQIKEYLEWEAK